MIPAWYAAAGMVTTGLLGAVTTHLAGSGRRSRLLKRTTRVVAELRRLTTWMPSAQYWEAGIREDRWAVWSRALPAGTLDREKPARRQGLVQHAAPTVDIDWHRGEHGIYSWGWLVEVAARFASIGRTFVWRPEEHPTATPKHVAWNVGTQEIAQVVAEETRRRDEEFEALLYAMVAKGAVLR